jgi:hypothetical protein
VIRCAANNGEGGTLALMALAHAPWTDGSVGPLFIAGAARCAFDAPSLRRPSLRDRGPNDTTLTSHHEVLRRRSCGAARCKRAAPRCHFGPVMCIWFVAIAPPGIYYIGATDDPAAFNPAYGSSSCSSTA